MSCRLTCVCCFLLPHHNRGSYSATGIAGGGWDEESFEGRPQMNFAIGNRVQRASAGERKIWALVCLIKTVEQREEDLFVDSLCGAGQIFVSLTKRITGFSC